MYAHAHAYTPNSEKEIHNWALVSEPGFLDLQIFRMLILEIFVVQDIMEKRLVGYRRINNKGVLDRPWTIWRVLKAFPSTLKLKFTVNHENKKI